jgi:hypothetical protein
MLIHIGFTLVDTTLWFLMVNPSMTHFIHTGQRWLTLLHISLHCSLTFQQWPILTNEKNFHISLFRPLFVNVLAVTNSCIFSG